VLPKGISPRTSQETGKKEIEAEQENEMRTEGKGFTLGSLSREAPSTLEISVETPRFATTSKFFLADCGLWTTLFWQRHNRGYEMSIAWPELYAYSTRGRRCCRSSY
jgi:hypothetical protein